MKFLKNFTKDAEAYAVLKGGVIVSAVWLLACVAYALLVCTVSEFKSADKIGAYVQGVVAPLAFGWLIIAVLLQTKELGLQREELTLNREELRKSVEQFTAQTEIAREEREAAKLNDRARGLNARIDGIARQLYYLSNDVYVQWKPDGRDRDESLSLKSRLGDPHILERLIENEKYDDFLRRFSHGLKLFNTELERVTKIRRRRSKVPLARLGDVMTLLMNAIAEVDADGLPDLKVRVDLSDTRVLCSEIGKAIEMLHDTPKLE